MVTLPNCPRYQASIPNLTINIQQFTDHLTDIKNLKVYYVRNKRNMLLTFLLDNKIFKFRFYDSKKLLMHILTSNCQIFKGGKCVTSAIVIIDTLIYVLEVKKCYNIERVWVKKKC